MRSGAALWRGWQQQPLKCLLCKRDDISRWHIGHSGLRPGGRSGLCTSPFEQRHSHAPSRPDEPTLCRFRCKGFELLQLSERDGLLGFDHFTDLVLVSDAYQSVKATIKSSSTNGCAIEQQQEVTERSNACTRLAQGFGAVQSQRADRMIRQLQLLTATHGTAMVAACWSGCSA